MTINIDPTKSQNTFVYAGQKFEVRRQHELDSDEEIVRYEVFIDGKELDLSELLDGNDWEELFDYLHLPYASDSSVLKPEFFPTDKLNEYLLKIATRYVNHCDKGSLFLD